MSIYSLERMRARLRTFKKYTQNDFFFLIKLTLSKNEIDNKEISGRLFYTSLKKKSNGYDYTF